MCWKCQEIDKEIGHYRGLSARTQDEGSVKSLDILIARLEAEKKERSYRGVGHACKNGPAALRTWRSRYP